MESQQQPKRAVWGEDSAVSYWETGDLCIGYQCILYQESPTLGCYDYDIDIYKWVGPHSLFSWDAGCRLNALAGLGY